MADDDAIEIDEFAMFQARSMGVETEYLEMAKAGRHQGRSSHNRRGEESSPGTSSGRRRGQRSSGGRQRSSNKSRGDEEPGTPFDSPNSPRQCDAACGDGNCRVPRSGGPDDENSGQDGEEQDERRENGGTDEFPLQPLHRSHSYRSKRSGDKPPSWAEEDPAKPDEVFEQQNSSMDPVVKCDLKRTLTMPAKRHRDRAMGKSSVDSSGRESIRSWSSRSRDPPALREVNDDVNDDEYDVEQEEEDEESRTSADFRGKASRTRRSVNGDEAEIGIDGRPGLRGRLEEARVGKGCGVAWKDTVATSCHGNPINVHDPGSTTAGKRSSLLRHDSSGSCQLRNPQTPESSRRRTSNETSARGSSSTGDTGKTGTLERPPPENGRGGGDGDLGIRDPACVGVRVATSRVERPPPGDEATVYKVLVLGSQGVGKSTVTRQLLAAGNADDDDDESSEDRIVSVQVDDDESLLEFIDSAASQANRTKQVADANLVVYSVTDRPSFAFAQSCLQELRPAKRHNVVILVANKQDLVRNRVISEDDGKSLAAKRHCKFIEVSALLSLKMDDLLIGIARQIRLRKGRATGAAAQGGGPVDRETGRADPGAPDTGFGCLQRAALHAIRKVFRRRPVESTSCDNLCTP